MSRQLPALALALALLTAAGPAGATALTLGVFLPEGPFATNAERSAWAQSLADALGRATGGAHTFSPQLFARRADALAFVQARRVDLLVADGLFAADLSLEALAHAGAAPAAALYAPAGTTVESLAGQPVALAETSTHDLAFYAQAALAGEVDPERYFAAPRRAKDTAAALGAVRAGAAPAAFAPADHPAAAGLARLAAGGQLPPVVVAVTSSARLDDPTRASLTAALLAGAGAGLGGWRAGPSDAFARARAIATAAPRVLSAEPRLAERPDDRPVPPPLRLRTSAPYAPPGGAPAALVAPRLAEDP